MNTPSQSGSGREGLKSTSRLPIGICALRDRILGTLGIAVSMITASPKIHHDPRVTLEPPSPKKPGDLDKPDIRMFTAEDGELFLQHCETGKLGTEYKAAAEDFRRTRGY
jgi:hypothetical protein